MDRSRLIAAAIIAVGLIVGGFLAGGRYEMASSGGNSVTRLDRWTGQIEACITDSADPASRCGYVQSGNAYAPPCRDGSENCDPWEREWGEEVPPEGTIVRQDGYMIEPPQGG